MANYDDYPVLYEWSPDPSLQDGIRDLPLRYRIVSCPGADDGIMVLAEYNSGWQPNPWNTRTLIKHLMETAIAFQIGEVIPACPNCGNEFFCEVETY